MAYEQKDNTGSLFQNKEKRSENFPDYSGSLRIDGVDWRVSGWRKTSKDGTPWLSLSIKPKDGAANAPDKAEEFKREAQRVFPGAKLSDDLPF